MSDRSEGSGSVSRVIDHGSFRIGQLITVCIQIVLTLFRPKEDHPSLEVVHERLKGVRDAGCDEQEIAWPGPHPLGTAAEYAGAAAAM